MPSFSHYAEYGFLRTLEGIVTLLPRRAALQTGLLFGGLLYRARFLRHVVDTNLDYTHTALGSGREAFVRELYRNFGRYCTDFLQPVARKLPFDNDHHELLERARSEGKGYLVVLAHLGNWEALAAIFGRRVTGLHAVSQKMSNPLVGSWLMRKRAATGVTEIDKDKALRPILKCLKNNQPIALLIDQHAAKHGTPVPFLGRDAMTVRTAAGLAHRTGAPVLLAFCILGEDLIYRIHITQGRRLPSKGYDEDAIIDAYQRQHNDILSEWIRAYPTHYFGWFHKRFRGSVSYSKKRQVPKTTS